MRDRSGKRARTRNRGCLGVSSAFLLAGLLFGSFFAARAWRDVRIFTTWRPATCTIVDKSLASRGGTGRSKPSYRPDITFTYEVGGRGYRCTGWDSWALAGDYGGGSAAYYERVLDRYEVGRSVPCWYDPADPTRAVLVRRIRPLYVLAVMPLALAALGAFGLWASLAAPARGGSAARERSRAGHAPSAPWDEPRLAVRLRPDSKPGDQSCGALLISVALLFVGGLAGYAAWSDWQDGEWHVIPLLFVAVFGGLGLLFLWIATASALASKVPETIVEVERSTIAPGGAVKLVVRQPGPLRLRRLRVKVTAEEETPRREGSPDVTPLYQAVVTEVGSTAIGREVPLEREAELRIPEDAKPSAGGPPTVRWRVEVWGVPRVWPRFLLKFPIMVAREAARPERDEVAPGRG